MSKAFNSFSLSPFRFQLSLLLRYMIIQYLIRTFAPSCLSPAICFLTFQRDELSFFIDPEIASFSSCLFRKSLSFLLSFPESLPCFLSFRLPAVSGFLSFFSPLSFGTAKVWTFFKLANFIFFIFVCLFSPLFSSLVCGLQRCDFFS